MLGGRKIETRQGKLERLSYLVACDYCGKHPLQTFLLCSVDREKLCDDCYVKVDGKAYCRTHLADVLPLSRNGYKVLLCAKAEIESVSKIAEMCRLDKDDVKLSLAVLAEMKYVNTSGILAFLSRKITGEGIRVLSVYSKLFDADEDVVEVKNRLQEEDNDGT
jgi:hypothetical protein